MLTEVTLAGVTVGKKKHGDTVFPVGRDFAANRRKCVIPGMDRFGILLKNKVCFIW